MSKLPVVNFKTMEKLLLQLGFEVSRQKGSHVFYRHPDGSKDLARRLIREILREIEISPEQYKQELDQL